MKVEPVTLEGKRVRLEPLGDQHAEDLATLVGPEEIWTWMSARPVTLADTRSWIETALAAQAGGSELPFAIIDKTTDRAVGSTRFLDIQPHHRGVEIGWTWLGRNAWRTPINTECKYLLLRHAFETWNCIRVQLKTDRRNERSRRAIERIGGQFEGILRNHRVLSDGTYRDSAYYSIIDVEWPEVKTRLETKMAPDSVAAPDR
ncbi:MAG TPA: GNAT family N-acetyltransferase [Thermomicrobiales bacterium]|jgi:RimJ/RimL family protein N-acetyltransferase|nr:GNAT family N-acetyltransferase [Thermomicrobiales bacterium]